MLENRILISKLIYYQIINRPDPDYTIIKVENGVALHNNNNRLIGCANKRIYKSQINSVSKVCEKRANE